MDEEEDTGTIFVFYTPTGSFSWKSLKYPSRWWWVGAGTTSAINDTKLRHTHEVQFSGPLRNRNIMEARLNLFLRKTLNKGKISIYKIRYSFVPHDPDEKNE